MLPEDDVQALIGRSVVAVKVSFIGIVTVILEGGYELTLPDEGWNLEVRGA